MCWRQSKIRSNIFKTIYSPRNMEWRKQWNYLSFQSTKFYERKAKYDKRNFKRGLSMTFVVKNT